MPFKIKSLKNEKIRPKNLIITISSTRKKQVSTARRRKVEKKRKKLIGL